MNKSELVSAMVEKAGISKKDAEAALKAFTETVVEEMKKGEKVQLVGFGTFESVTKAAKEAINPITKEKVSVPERKAPKMKWGKAVKDALNS